jgi:molecular chaperone HscB
MDPFATLGLPRQYDLDKAALDRRYRDLQQTLHPDRHASAPPAERAVTLQKAVGVNEAYRVLRDDLKRGEALLALLGGRVDTQTADPELLMEMMELREALTEARAAGDATEVARLAAQVEQKAVAARQELTSTFAALPTAGPASAETALATAQGLLGRLRYYRRFQDEVTQFEDEALA